jgi:hypothetical protein
MARGSNNKEGTSGTGTGNQSNQGFGQAADRGKSYHGQRTGGKPSVPEKKKGEQSSNRNTNLNKENE